VTAALLLVLAAGLADAGSSGTNSAAAQRARDYATLDVCQIVSGDAIARAVGGKLTGTRSFKDKSFSRCAYFVVLPGDKQTAYRVWLQPPEDFEDLKKYTDSPFAPVAGLGDGAWMFQDKGDGLFKINVLKRGDVMFQATADSAESARKVADAVVSQLWKKVP
jgi:hypothetical protein